MTFVYGTPSDLISWVRTSLPPGAELVHHWPDRSKRAWGFTLRASGTEYKLLIPVENFDDGLRDEVTLRARLACPCPDATVKGHEFSILYDRLEAAPDGTASVNLQFSTWQDEPADTHSVIVEVTGTVAAVLEQRATHQISGRGLMILAAVFAIKQALDARVSLTEPLLVSTANLDDILTRPRAPDTQIRDYVRSRLHRAYVQTGVMAAVQFDWVDLQYLGVAEQAFHRAVLIESGRDWTISGSTLTPAVEMLRRLEDGARTATHAIAEIPVVDVRDVFISHAGLPPFSRTV